MPCVWISCMASVTCTVRQRQQAGRQGGSRDGRQAGRQAGRAAGGVKGRPAGRTTGRQDDRQDDRQAGRTTGRQDDRQAGGVKSRQRANVHLACMVTACSPQSSHLFSSPSSTCTSQHREHREPGRGPTYLPSPSVVCVPSVLRVSVHHLERVLSDRCGV